MAQKLVVQSLSDAISMAWQMRMIGGKWHENDNWSLITVYRNSQPFAEITWVTPLDNRQRSAAAALVAR